MISEDANVVEKFRADHPGKVITFNETLGMDDETRRIVEIDLFAKCNEKVVTGGSTYGYVAVFKSGRLPYYVNGKINSSRCAKADISHPGFRSDYGASPLYRTY